MRDERILMEERYLPEKEGLLGGRTTLMSADGSIRKDIRIPFCDSCGQMMTREGVAICSCGRKVCPSCTVIHENRAYCLECARQMANLAKEEFFILYGLDNGATLDDIKHAASMGSDDLEEVIETLVARGLIEEKGISVFARHSVTYEGLTLLLICQRVYRNEEDVLRFFKKLGDLGVCDNEKDN